MSGAVISDRVIDMPAKSSATHQSHGPARAPAATPDASKTPSTADGDFVATIDASPRVVLQGFANARIQQSPLMAVQRKAIASFVNGVGPAVQRKDSRPSNQTGLPDNLKSGIESLSGMSMDAVKVHYNSSQPAQLNALAYAQGTDIHVGPGQEQHLPHEAWHVVQQAQGRVKPTTQMKEGVPVNDDEGLEREADTMGARALQQGTAIAGTSAANPVQKVDAKYADTLRAAYLASSEDGAVNQGAYTQYLVEHEYPFEDDSADDFEATQFKRDTVQLARAPYAISGPKNYGGLNQVLYQCDGVGNIDFSNPSQFFIGNPYPGLNPVVGGSTVDVTNAVNNHGTANRYQHFKEANTAYGTPQHGGNSPPGLTWHHLTAQYDMHLVDRLVHSKHGHNGGVYLW